MKKILLLLSLLAFIGLFSQENEEENKVLEDKFYYNKKTHINISGGGFIPNDYDAYPVSALLEYRFFKSFSLGGEFIFYYSNKENPYENFPFFGSKIRTAFHVPFFLFDFYIGVSFNFYINHDSPQLGMSFFSGLRVGFDFIGVSVEGGVESRSIKTSSYVSLGIYFRF